MAIEIVKTFVVKAAPSAVWDFLVDPERVARCMPGAAISAKIDDKTYTGTMTVKVGPVTSSYKGRIVFNRLDAATRTAEIAATGQESRGKGGAEMQLTSTLKELAPAETEVTAVSKLNITGILAQMGRGIIQDVSDQMFQIFSERMRAELEKPAAAAPAPAAPAAPDAAAAPAASAAPDPSDPPPEALGPDPAPPPAAAAKPEVLDVGAIGAKAAGRAALRMLRSPILWLVVIAIAVALYLLSR